VAALLKRRKKESVTPFFEMAEHKNFGAAKKLIVAGLPGHNGIRAQDSEQVPGGTRSSASLLKSETHYGSCGRRSSRAPRRSRPHSVS